VNQKFFEINYINERKHSKYHETDDYRNKSGKLTQGSSSPSAASVSFFYPEFTRGNLFFARFLPAAPAKKNTNKQHPGKFTRG